MPTPPPSDLAGLGLAQIARLASDQKLPPVDQWTPTLCGPSRIVIRRDGSWVHEGSLIRRPEMVRLFARLLRCEADGSIVLVTPVEKLEISVEDTPFVAVEVRSEGRGTARQLAFRLMHGEIVLAGADHPIRVEDGEAGPRPLLGVRPGLEARIERSVYYELAGWALEESEDAPGLWSGGSFFSLEGGG